MDALRRHSPVAAAPEGTTELKKSAVGFEEKIYAAAVNQSYYLRKISLKLLSMESKTEQNTPMNPLPGINKNSTDAGVVGKAGNSRGGATSEETAAAATTKEVA
ncbi:mediator of RNA polymerase II transcription subunit 15a [Dendrobium catenatum]|uniref:mediator of RNA polymerase II transcription subunit 15a n=1 Tax=Dendrobium catenatum TaxID=906689 RepID=UPI0010A05C12|nr:mediator of RNA polymerase II transcription subunit 15a [Dendrobium catenatum]